MAYTAFGEEALNTGTGETPPYTYTGKELDSTGLMYYGARYYDPVLCRFITPDTVYDAGTQGLNRYSYALNNPIVYRDPTGNFINGPDDETNPTCYGCVTGSQAQFDDGTAYVHSGRGFSLPLSEFDARVMAPLTLGGPITRGQYLGDGMWGNPAEARPVEPMTTADILNEYGYTPTGLSQNASNISSMWGPIERSDAEMVRMQIELLQGHYGNAFHHWKNSWKAAATEPGTYIEAAISLGTFAASQKPVTSLGQADAIQYQKLKQQLASQEQMGELATGKGKPLIGSGTNRILRDAERLAAQYGGDPGDWAKVSSSNKSHITGYNQETHAYMNMKTGQVVEMKTKISGH